MVDFLNNVKKKGSVAELKFEEFVSKLAVRRKLEWESSGLEEALSDYDTIFNGLLEKDEWSSWTPEERLQEAVQWLTGDLDNIRCDLSDLGVDLLEKSTELNNEKCNLFAFRNTKGGLTFIDPEDYNLAKASKNLDKIKNMLQFMFTREVGLPSDWKQSILKLKQPEEPQQEPVEGVV